MLTTLTIQNVVLIERLTIELGGGLCALTGETGAGKSILLDALGLALGERADTGLIRAGADQASVTAILDRPDAPDLIEQLDSLGIPGHEPELILRRTLGRDGRSRAFVNDQPVSVSALKSVAAHLLEIHGQFETQGLRDPSVHGALLDRYGDLAGLVGTVETGWRDWQQAEQQRQRLLGEIERARTEEDYLRHALGELDELSPAPGEEEALAEARARLMNREKIMAALASAGAELAGDAGAMPLMASARRTLERGADKIGAEQVDRILAPLDRAQTELDEAAAELEAVLSALDHDPRGLEEIEDRLFTLRQLARKHNVPPDQLPALRDDFARRLDMIDDQSAHLDRAARAATAARQGYLAAAGKLSEARRKTAGSLDKAVMQELKPLKLGNARFVTELGEQAEAQWGPNGIERVRFTVATNPGQDPGPIDRIASGGELARFMLALKVALRRISVVPTLIFDEVDTGIGGAVADAVGERLARLGEDVQVLVVTHAPQVAARARHHYRIAKHEQAAGLPVTEVVLLEPQARREEIARMLSGAEVSDEARAAADRLLATA